MFVCAGAGVYNMCLHVYLLRIVSTDKILRFIITLIILLLLNRRHANVAGSCT